jgi:endonuclease YncB( thermonuclease family)
MLSALAVLVGIASVIDGDTLEIHGQRIRFHGVDAPESRQICQLDGKPWRCGTAAANALADWIGQRTVSCEDRGQDRYKRVIASCTVDGVNIEVWLVENGWALDYVKYSEGLYSSQQEDAKRQRRGIWASEFEEPWDWRRSRR